MPIRSSRSSIRSINELISNCGPPHKKTAFCWLCHQSNNSDTSESLEDQKKQTHSWDNSNNSNPNDSNLSSTEWNLKKEQKNNQSKVLFHRKSYTTSWTSIGVHDFFRWNEWKLETRGSGMRVVLKNELSSNKIVFPNFIYRFLFTFFKANWSSFSPESPISIRKLELEKTVATEDLRSLFFQNFFVPDFSILAKWWQ